ncbi:tyrosine-type recombinase/integrase [Terasakiella sp.]|uniref:tyrosine-type recombinase/integrase n=1 Tax=Terasakiella sp. TaxID=2034861 RepID=UPI003AA86A04
MSIRKNLRQRTGGGWAVVYYVPDEFRELIGKREIVRGLGTKDIHEANRRKHKVLIQIQKEVFDRIDPLKEAANLAVTINPDDDPEEVYLISKAEEIERQKGYTTAKQYYDIATRKVVPVSMALDQWLQASDGIQQSTLNRYKIAVKEFIDWGGDVPIADLTRRRAGDYFEYLKQTLSPKTKRPYAPKTYNAKLKALSSLWRWCGMRGYFEDHNHNPWRGIASSAPGERKKPKTVKTLRPIYREEAQTWLRAINDGTFKHKSAMNDLIILAWHTGVRANDLCELTTDRVVFDKDDQESEVVWITIISGKSEANTRILPIVSPEAIKALQQRVKAAENNELFPELTRAGEDNKKYHNLQKTINRIRTSTFKNAPFDMHSFRRRFSSACEDVGMDPVQWSRMMGHSAPTLAASVYNKGHKARKRLLTGIKEVHEELGELT